jgi:hypothetical protein
MRERGSVSSICEQIARAATRLLRNLVADSGELMEREEQRKLAAESRRYAELGRAATAKIADPEDREHREADFPTIGP